MHREVTPSDRLGYGGAPPSLFLLTGPPGLLVRARPSPGGGRRLSPRGAPARLGYGGPPLSLYLLTALLGLLIGADLWPVVAGWLWPGDAPAWLPSWPREVLGYRFALVAAVLGGSRVLVTSLEGLLEGRVG